MPTTSPIPVLRNSLGATLRYEDEALVLRRPDEEVRIPLPAVARIRAEGRTLAVELTARAGAAPAVHALADVSEAAAALFADAVTANLPERAAGAEPVDGSALVVVRVLTETPDEERRRRGRRRTRIGLVSVGSVFFALALAVGIHGQWIVALLTLLVGPVGAASLAYARMGVEDLYLQWYLPRDGITVQARQVGHSRIMGGGFGTYVYTDLHGENRTLHHRGGGPTVEAAYHPDKPHIVRVPESRGEKAGSVAVTMFLVLFGLVVESANAYLLYEAFVNGYPGYGPT
ncbi:hypothetical protein ACFW2T_06005 [Streptomyces sp. NPDC058892]|uniref:hypothetical protein n=1 Tax=unclassified Streptomyces TaxID=2593676 RepID=UPI0036B6B516